MLRIGRGLKTKAEARQLIGSVGQISWRKKGLLLFLALVAALLVFASPADGTNNQSTSQVTKSPARVTVQKLRQQHRAINRYKAHTRKWAHKRGIHVRYAHARLKWSSSVRYNTFRIKRWKAQAKKQRLLYKRYHKSLRPCVKNGVPKRICIALRGAAPAAGVPKSWANSWHLAYVLRRESGFSCNAQNPSSTAYGLFQFLNSTWSGTGVRKTSSCYGQAKAGLIYIKRRYGSPIGAYNHSKSHGWY